MHHGSMFSSHWKKVFSEFSGTKRVRPSRTACNARSARGFTFTYHWSVR